MPKPLTLIADSNMAYLDDYFNTDILGCPVNLIKFSGRQINQQALQTHQPDALLIRSVTPINQTLLKNNQSVQFIGSATVGTDHIDFATIAQHTSPIQIAHAQGCSKHSVAQYVLTAIFANITNAEKIPLKLGIIGLGNIGSTLANYAQDLGWQVIGYDPFLPKSTQNLHDLDFLLKNSQAISLHVPLTKTGSHPTHHLIDQNALQKIAPNTLIINTARGSVIKESDLILHLDSQNNPTVLDVFEHEPIVSQNLLQRLKLATPHIAGYTLEGKLRGTQRVYEQFCTHFGIPIRQQMQNLLPDNPYHWQDLQKNPERINDFYDIHRDDRELHRALNPNDQQVNAQDFDSLRKNYPIRREWQI